MQVRGVLKLAPEADIVGSLGEMPGAYHTSEGGFMGRLGRARTFLVHQSGANLKIPSDLPASPLPPMSGLERTATINLPWAAACDSLRDVIRDLGFAK